MPYQQGAFCSSAVLEHSGVEISQDIMYPKVQLDMDVDEALSIIILSG